MRALAAVLLLACARRTEMPPEKPPVDAAAPDSTAPADAAVAADLGRFAGYSPIELAAGTYRVLGTWRSSTYPTREKHIMESSRFFVELTFSEDGTFDACLVGRWK